MVDKYFKGDYHYDNGNYEQAILWYDDINDSRAWFRKGLCYENLKDFNKAIECFNKIRKSDKFYHKAKIEKNKCLSKLNNKPKSKNKPKSAPSNTNINLYFQGDYHYDNGNYEQAILWYDDVTNQYPYDGKAWFRKGLCYENLKDFNKAIECFENIPKNDTFYHKAKIEKNKCLSKLNTMPKTSPPNTPINNTNLKSNRCPNCNAPVNLDDNFCQNCGYQIQNETKPLITLKESVDRVINYISLYQYDNTLDKNEYPLIEDCKSKNMYLTHIFLDDFFRYLCYLGVADGKIANEEVDFFNFIFEKQWTKQEIEEVISITLEEDITQSLPLSFMLLYETDLNRRKNSEYKDFEYVESLFMTYELMGQIIISIDNDIAQYEIDFFNHYMNRLRENLDNFKQFGYKYIVNSMISETQINQNTNQNSVKHNFCPSCGAKVEDKYKFCIKCGAPIK